ncbi:hypothetical protein R3P38DRAFT_2802317 [Favolaschia claudopus]|uniref:Uncharacterized protein n=1 Tax=Favolaschia claudopus TaxID=2862362 RepID=A0AAV9ZVH4_9AGAR
MSFDGSGRGVGERAGQTSEGGGGAHEPAPAQHRRRKQMRRRVGVGVDEASERVGKRQEARRPTKRVDEQAGAMGNETNVWVANQWSGQAVGMVVAARGLRRGKTPPSATTVGSAGGGGGGGGGGQAGTKGGGVGSNEKRVTMSRVTIDTFPVGRTITPEAGNISEKTALPEKPEASGMPDAASDQRDLRHGAKKPSNQRLMR